MLSSFLNRVTTRIRSISPTSIPSKLTTHTPHNRLTKSEPLERYCSGGYHAVKIGDVFNERFKVCGKLGWGRFSTVWEATDTRSNTDVALKILTADCTAGPNALDELGTLKRVTSANPSHPGYPHFQHLLDDFTIEGPNGTHICLVLERYRNSLDTLWRDDDGVRHALPTDLVKIITRDVLLALTYLHEECGLVHTDIKPDNILFSEPQTPDTDDKSKLWDPYLASFKLIDLGHANLVDKPFATLIQPPALRAPEVVLGRSWGTPADMWNLGCIIYELVVGQSLFAPLFKLPDVEVNPGTMHLAQIIAVCGQIPLKMRLEGEKVRRYFDEQGRPLATVDFPPTIMQEMLIKVRVPEDEAKEIASFLMSMLCIDPEERVTAAQALKHPWVAR
ncbi:kinase-like domain-containing protein [Irpex rosettiformis]|uniref:Kinase-like domain-containing protein n=1 Tax=Irpex rosettiformis TaxID=378272 RepID=A0ACB8U8T3_9APHY|nr:kinase-like domain-containing protein [Irpex rosettiformis]